MQSAMTEIIHGKDHLKRMVSSLSPEERRELHRILESMDDEDHEKTGSTASIKELRGLGKEVWRGIDVEDHVNRERDSWN